MTARTQQGCSIAGCQGSHEARGLCGKHYLRQWRYGRVNTVIRQRGTGTVSPAGYIRTKSAGLHTREHITVAERALGKPLPRGAIVHHVNESKGDNRPENLVVCPDSAYHALLHQRMRALAACGHVDWRKCPFCKQYDAPDHMRQMSGSNSFYHPACDAERRHPVAKIN